VASRYYLIDTSVSATTRLNAFLSRTAFLAGVRESPHQLGHIRRSLDGLRALAHGEVSDADHAALIALAYVVSLSYAGAQAEIAANPARWSAHV